MASQSRPAHVRIVSPSAFPLDPRHEQTRTPIQGILRQGRVFSKERSASCLLRLPDEILWVIIGFVAEEYHGRSLSQFALTHSECRQLARPYQFADVWITRSEISWGFLRYLKNEEAGVDTPSIGCLIRSLTFTIDADFQSYYAPCGYDKKLDEWSEYWGPMVEDLAEAIRHKTPMLDQIYWMDTGGLDMSENLFAAVVGHATPSGHLRRLYLEDHEISYCKDSDGFLDYRPPKPFPTSPTLPLRDLAFGFSRLDECWNDFCGESSRIVETFLRRSAKTLESFALNAFLDIGPDTRADFRMTGFRNGCIFFNKLRKFWTYTENLDNLYPDVVESLLSAPLESFAPSAELCSIMTANGLLERYPLPQLRTFAVTAAPSGLNPFDTPQYVDEVLRLGRSYGPQLHELFIYVRGYDRNEYDDNENNTSVGILVAHLSSGSFDNLRSLCFSWAIDPELETLRTIGCHLLALEELSFGFQPDEAKTFATLRDEWRFPWHTTSSPDHGDFIAAIAPLQRLERLCVFGDEFVADWAGDGWAWHRFFKDHVWFHQGRSFVHRERGKQGEGQDWSEATRGHTRTGDKVEDWLTPWVTGKESVEEGRQAVGEIAARYADVLPQLREFMAGRVLVEISRE
ncbi:uncharacterized protein F5Z01DRAFT_660964 [Emericellopsis atlantica]|uniref:Uncharacterized protein n=1 Tax=Emericellopsis atlantica TaxID=2614577 RepID=A0A9P8CML4_9HYPO|nr:uncharacterized protein F5Z01DRAFT_660964 [Emericellopsis atlantica]KAG9252568.1 hypothetical protein F5Z01DRAFT_660964 [Emericellopsis atlantica]